MRPPPSLDEASRARVETARAREVFLGCQIDVEADTLYEGARNLAVNAGETGMTWSTTTDYTNVRSGPSSQGFDIIDRLDNGTLVDVLERGLNPQRTHRWLRIAYTSEEGAAREGYVYFAQVRAYRPPVAPSAAFGDFPAVASSDADMDRSLIELVPDGPPKEAMEYQLEQGPNFAGSAVLATWGCGSGCAMAGILDPRTEVWFEVPFAMHRGLDRETPLFSFERDSTLLVARGWRNEEDPGLFEYHWNGRDLDMLSDDADEQSLDYSAYLSRARSDLQSGNADAAMLGFRRALAKAEGARNRVATMRGIADTARQTGAFEEGLAYALRAYQLMPNERWIEAYIASQEAAITQARAESLPVEAPEPPPPPRPLNEFETQAAPVLDMLDDLLGVE